MIRSLSLLGMMGLLVLAGCKSEGTAPTAAASGVVTYNGQPVPNAVVTFTPAEGRPAMGTTDATGKFVLSTFEDGDGAVPGSHKVTVNPAPSDTPMESSPEAIAAAEKAKPPFPKHYGNAEESGFTADVTEGGPNEFTFEMKD